MAVKNMTKKQIQIFFERLREQRPSPQTELKYSSPFELLIAVMLSAQATDVSVNKATDKLYPVANTAEKIYNLGVDGLKEYIKTIGLYNAKAENVIKTCKILMEQFNGEVPSNRKDLEALPGVGRKTANVVLNTLFKYTALQSSFSVNNIALVEGRPRLLNLKQIIDCFVKHRHKVVVRRAQFELNKAQARAHILEGLLKALDFIEAARLRDEITKLKEKL